MKNKKDIDNSSFAYSVYMLRLLLSMKLITEEEYRKIVQISAGHYDAETNICLIDNSADSRWMYPNSCDSVGVAGKSTAIQQ